MFLLRPLRRLLAMESMRLSHLMAELPKELAIEEAVVALVEEIVSSGHQEDALMDMAHDGAPREGADGAKVSKLEGARGAEGPTPCRAAPAAEELRAKSSHLRWLG